MIILCTSIIVGTVANYSRSDPYQVFQSPYYRKLPPNNDALIATLDRMDVDAVWIDHWAGKPLMFDSKERIAAADYVDLRVYGGIDRLSSATNRVFADESPAFVFVTDLPKTSLENTLTCRGIKFNASSVDGYRIVHPLEQVDPATVAEEIETVR